MKLAHQLGLVACTLCAVPWAGWQFLVANEQALLTLQRQGLEAAGEYRAAQLAKAPHLLYPSLERLSEPLDTNSLLSTPLGQRPIVDGYFNDWLQPQWRTFGTPRRPVSIALQSDQHSLFIALQITDLTKQYDDRSKGLEPNGDRLLLRTWLDNRRQDYVIATEAPGAVRARPDGRLLRAAHPERIRGVWTDVAGGYQVELVLPLTTATERLGFLYLDVDEGGLSTRGNISVIDQHAPPWLIRPSTTLGEWLSATLTPQLDLQIYDRWGWPMIATDTEPRRTSTINPAVSWLYRQLLPSPSEADSPLTGDDGRVHSEALAQALKGEPNHRMIARDGHWFAQFATPINGEQGVLGVVIAAQAREHYVSLTDSAFELLLVRGGMAIGLALLAVMGFASITSWRILRLKQHLDLGQVGSNNAVTSKPSWFNDEIDTLAKHFGHLLGERYRTEDYLRTLPRTLAHEIRTPVAIIGNCLEQLRAENLTADDYRTLLSRTDIGLKRLSQMLDAMNEANRLESALPDADWTELDCVKLLDDLVKAYNQTFSPWRFELDCALPSAPISVAPDAIVQALDKLVNNAMSFARKNSIIRLCLTRRGLWWRFSVINVGPALPADTAAIFAAMVSIRSGEDNDASTKTSPAEGRDTDLGASTDTARHMGLGLYVVGLIAHQHGGEPWARNLPEINGVEVGFTVRA